VAAFALLTNSNVDVDATSVMVASSAGLGATSGGYTAVHLAASIGCVLA
jgi:hypothetical protein